MPIPYIIVDASVAGAWSFTEPFSLQAQQVVASIEAHRVVALAPDRFAEELLRICQKKTAPPPDGAGIEFTDAWNRFLNTITSPIVLWPADELHEDGWRLAGDTGLTTHDTLYLALAVRWGAELWTLDDLLAERGSRVHHGVKHLRDEAFPY
jgi:predicted nucleic acid-binding protein